MARVRRWKPRLLPVVITAAGLLLTVKVDALWQGRGHFTEIAMAQQAPAAGTGQALTPGQFGKTPSGSDDVPQAAANPPPVTPATMTPAAAPPVPPTPMAAGGGTPVDLTASPDCSAQSQMLGDLAKRRAQLDQRSDDLDRRGLLLKAVEQRIDGKVQSLQKMQTTISALLGQFDQQQAERVNSLVHIYENMKPKDAAGILQQMDMPILLSLMSRMRDLRAGPILAAMDPDKARAITLALAQKQQLPDDAKNPAQSN